jgi:hypothetical protein
MAINEVITPLYKLVLVHDIYIQILTRLIIISFIVMLDFNPNNSQINFGQILDDFNFFLTIRKINYSHFNGVRKLLLFCGTAEFELFGETGALNMF